VTFFWTWVAQAERVVLLRPIEESPQLSEIFLRLQGELRMQGYEAVNANTDAVADLPEIKRIFALTAADACLSFETTKGFPTVHLWLIDRTTNLPQTFSLTGKDDVESASELPLRAVEMLRSSLLEQRDIANATGAKVAPLSLLPKVTGTVRPSPPKSLAWEVKRVSTRGSIGPTWGALSNQAFLETAFSIGVRILPHFELALLATVPLTTTKLRTNEATASYAFYQFGPEVRVLTPIGLRRFFLEYDAAIFATYLKATATAIEPWVAMNAAGWTATAQLGAGIWYQVEPYLALGLLTNLGFSAKRPIVEVGTRSQRLGRPYTSVALGLTARF
jgi:hypothetical protein